MQENENTQNTTPETTQTESTTPAETQVETSPNEHGDVDASEGAYEIEGKKFKTQTEAFDYARQLVAEKDKDLAVADAYRQAAQDFAGRSQPGQNVTPAQVEEPLFTEEEFYSNPQEAIKKVMAKTEAKVKHELTTAQAVAEQDRQTWNTFVTLHPDLDGFQKDVEAVAQEHASVVTALAQSRGQKAAMDYVAQKARAKFDAYWERRKPSKEMSRTNTSTHSANQKNVTPPKQPSESVAFRDEFRKLRAQRLGN